MKIFTKGNFKRLISFVMILGVTVILSNGKSCAEAASNDTKEVIFSISASSSNNWGEEVFAPYVQLSSGNPINVNDVHKKTGQKYYTFAFMNSNNGVPAWRGKYNYDTGLYDEEINTLRKNGGDIIISFGGASGRELATTISDVKKLQQAYQKVKAASSNIKVFKAFFEHKPLLVLSLPVRC